MKLTSKTRSHFINLMILGILSGTFAWAIIEKLSALAGTPFSLAVGPLGFDIGVLSLYMEVNPGSLIGAFAGYRLFASL